jgi:hypothetical protein
MRPTLTSDARENVGELRFLSRTYLYSIFHVLIFDQVTTHEPSYVDLGSVFSAGRRIVREAETKLPVVTPDAAIGTYEQKVMEEGFRDAFSFGSVDGAATRSASCGVTYSRKETHKYGLPAVWETNSSLVVRSCCRVTFDLRVCLVT